MTPSRYGATRLALLAALSTLSLTACGADPSTPSATEPDAPPPSSPPSQPSPAEAFTSYAAGPGAAAGRAEVPWGDVVVYRIDGEQVARLDPDAADRPRSWDGCPAGASSYEGRECPVSPLRTIALVQQEGDPLVHDSERPETVGCNRYPTPGQTATATTTWIRPPLDRRDCFSDFAVAVSLDASGDVTAIDLTLSGP